MSVRKAERIVNLAICLLMARRFLLKHEIRQAVEQYRLEESAQAFEKLFERDKEELRQLGVPLQTGSNDPWHPEEIGYRILRKDFELPPIDFETAELAVLGVAAQVWDAATQADQAKTALAKLRAVGADPDPGRLAALAPSMAGKEDAFPAMWQAVVRRIPVAFGYHGKRRRLQPWAITHRHGAWYVWGWDLDAAEQRVYRLTRVETAVRFIDEPGSYQPEQLDLAQFTARIEPARADSQALLAIQTDAAPALRRRGELVETEQQLPPGYQAYRVAYSADSDFVGELCAQGPQVLVLAPEELRAAVVEQLLGFLEVG